MYLLVSWMAWFSVGTAPPYLGKSLRTLGGGRGNQVSRAPVPHPIRETRTSYDKKVIQRVNHSTWCRYSGEEVYLDVLFSRPESAGSTTTAAIILQSSKSKNFILAGFDISQQRQTGAVQRPPCVIFMPSNNLSQMYFAVFNKFRRGWQRVYTREPAREWAEPSTDSIMWC